MRIEFEKVVPADTLDSAWALYNKAFEELRRAAVQRHVMYRDEFDQVMADPRVGKYRAFDPADETTVTGLATFTNELLGMPLVSPDYFANRWPQLYAEKRIWYIGFFAIDPDHRGDGIFENVIAHMWQQVLGSNGIAMLDICRRNDQLGLPYAIHQVLRALTPGAEASRVDEQTYWLYDPADAA